MTTAPLDQVARDRITVGGLAETLFVEAGAGSGKTTQLVARIVNLVLEGEVPLSAIAAITFTEAAAAELRTRIRAAFESAAGAGPPERSALATAALAEADSAAISTVHGFANRILAERPLAVGLPPRTRVLDEVASRVQMEDRWSTFVEGLHHLAQTDPSTEALLVRTSALGVEFEPRYPSQQTLKTLALAFAQNWDRLDSYRTRQPQPLPPIDWSDLDRAVDEALEFDIDARCNDHSDRLYDQLCGTTFPALRVFRDQREPEARLQLLRGSPWKATNGRAPAWPEGAKPQVVALVKAAETARQELVAQVSHDLLNETIAQVAHNEVSAADARRAAGTLEFHDLLVLARNLLRNDLGARQQLGASYRYLLLDEFQDTDPIQIELAVLIAGSIVGSTDDEMTDPHWWSTIPVEDGRLFFVGDPKQSIYRFRRADIGLFLRAMQRFGQPDGSDVVRLTTNFRSVPPLLDFVNRLFSDLMVEDGDKQPRYEALTSHRTDAPAADHRPVLLGGPHPDPKVGADTLRELEAADVAATVAAIRADPEQWPVWDRETQQWRPAALADITILIPTRTSLPYLRRALDLEAVPFRLATGTLVYDSQEIRDVLSVLRAIDDQTDEISLVAALRSPLLACSDVDLFTFHQAGGRWRFTSTPPVGLPSDHPVLRSFDLLRSLWDQRWWLSPSAMVDQVQQSCAVALLGFGAVRPADVWNRHRFLLDQARLFEESAGGGLREFLRWTELQSAEGSRIHEPILAETDEDTVKVMTVHSAKGLEFPITVLSGTTTIPGNGNRGMSLKWDADGVPALKWTKGVATAGHDALADLEAEMDENEKLRLLYVALTRACDHLVISCHHKASKPTSWSAQVHLAASGYPDLWRQLDLADPGQRNHPQATEPAPADRVTTPGPDTPGHPEGTDEASRDAWRADRAAVIGTQRAARVVSATGVARGMAGSGSAEAGPLGAVDEPTQDQLDDDGADSTTVPRRRGRVGNAIGSATHATLQILDLRDPSQIEAQVTRQCEIESIPEHAATVLDLVRSALGSDAVRLASEHPHHKELYVIAPIDEHDDTLAIEGYVDLLVDTPDGLVVIDYKTDTVTDDRAIDEKVSAYRWQGAAYAVALEQVTGQPVVECRFVFCRPSGAVERSVGDLRQAMDEVRRFLQPESAATR